MTGWELSFGLYPGVLLGVRSYPEENICRARVLFTFY